MPLLVKSWKEDGRIIVPKSFVEKIAYAYYAYFNSLRATVNDPLRDWQRAEECLQTIGATWVEKNAFDELKCKREMLIFPLTEGTEGGR